MVVGAFGIKNGYCWRHLFIGDVMVADNEVDAQRFGVSYFVDGLNSAVEDDNKLYARLVGIIYAFATNAVAFFVAVGYVILDVGVELLKEFIHEGNRCASVDIVVAIHHDALFTSHGIVKPVYGHVHVFHQKGVDDVVELRTEETLGRTFCCYAPTYEQLS